MKSNLLFAVALLALSAFFATSPAAWADGCDQQKTDSTGRTCKLQSETVTTCTYYNDSDPNHCSGGGDYLLLD
jgi:hypothetical protein